MCSAADPGTSGIYTSTIWADGVSLNSGWWDVDKSPSDTQELMMCYAAAATNLITWWQNGTYGSQLTSSAPTGINDIWATYKAHNVHPKSYGDSLAAINWWISGVYAPTNEKEQQRSLFNPVPDSSLVTLETFSGFYYDQYGLNKGKLAEFLDLSTDYSASLFGSLLSEGAGVSLLLKSDEGRLAHIITLWGAEYTTSGNLTRLWVTDSDDAFAEQEYGELFPIDVVTGNNGKIYFNEEAEIGYYKLHQTLETGIKGIHVYCVNSIHPKASASWQLVPEPSSATLGILALAALVAYRHRASR